MPETTYNYSISGDTLNGSVSAGKLHFEVATSSITIALERVDTGVLGADNLDIVFKDAISAGEKTTLDGIVAAHDGIDDEVIRKFHMIPRVGGPQDPVDGIHIVQGANLWADYVYTLPEDYSLKGVTATWVDCFPGDYAWVAVINPLGEVLLPLQLNIDDTEVDVGSDLVEGVPRYEYYDPANGAQAIEFWDTITGDIKEVRKITGINAGNNKVQVSPAISQLFVITTTKCVLRLGGFSPIRGATGIDGGFRMVGSGTIVLDKESRVSDNISANLQLCTRVKTTSDVGDRCVGLNFLLREKE